jgi:ornithine carbamoyltransferase
MKKIPRTRLSASLRGTDFLSIDDLAPEQILHLLALARTLKANPKKYRRALEGMVMALIFEKPSLRTRTTFAVGMTQLGGDALYLSPAEISLGKRESVHDVAKNLERMVNGVMIRTFGHDICESFARHAAIPVINGLTDHEHPCQAMADFLTLVEKKRKLTALKLTYVGDGNNVAHSLMLLAAKLGARMVVAAPEGYQPSPAVVARAQEIARSTGGAISTTTDPAEAAEGADMIYTDTWTSMGQEAEGEIRRKAFAGFQVNRALVARAKRDFLFMHCLPAHRGEEVTDEIIDSPNSVVFDQAENRLHVQKAIMHELLRRR